MRVYRPAADALLGLLPATTLLGWNAFGRLNPYHVGTVALIVKLALIVAFLLHAAGLRATQERRPRGSGRRRLNAAAPNFRRRHRKSVLLLGAFSRRRIMFLAPRGAE